MALSFQQIQQAQDRKPIGPINVPEWGGDVYIRIIAGIEKERFEKQAYKDGGIAIDNLKATFLSLTLSDENGNRIVTDEQVTLLGDKSSKVIERLFSKAWKANGFSKSDIEELEKN